METTRLTDPSFWIDRSPYAPGAAVPTGAGDPDGLVWFKTSGTSGAPRWIGHSREGLLLSAAVVNRHLDVTESSVWGLALPLHHVGGFGVVARAHEAACRLSSFTNKWDPSGCRDWLLAEGVSHLSLVPTQVHDLVVAGISCPASLKAVVVGGGRLDRELGQAARDLGWPVLASYGMTETASQIATQRLELLEMPYENSSLTVLSHWKLRASVDGGLQVSGESLFRATLEPEGSSWRFVRREYEWLETRDRVELDGNLLSVSGRLDRVVKVLGELVDLVAVEKALCLDGVAVIATDDPRRGARLVTFFEGDDPSGEIARYNSTAEGPWRISESIRVDELPRTSLGKIRYGALGS